jgi:hypothetical protein
LSAFTGMVVGLSTMLAIRTGFEQIEAGEDEVKAWLKAAQRVARHYSVKTTQVALDWIAFMGMTAQVWGTRAVAVAVEGRGEGETRRPPPARGSPGNVRPFPGPRPQAPPAVPEPPGPEMGVEPEGGF